MPHPSVIIGGAVIVAGAAVLVNELFIQPARQRRREEREAREAIEEREELDRAIALSLYEYDRENERNRLRGRSMDNGPFSDAYSSANPATFYRGSDVDHGDLQRTGLRRRRQPEPSQFEIEMQERPRDVLFDAGPSSRLDTSFVLPLSPAARSPTSSTGRSGVLPEDTATLSEEELQEFLSPTSSLYNFVSQPSRTVSPDGQYASMDSAVPANDDVARLPREASPTPTVRSATATDTTGTLVSRPHSPTASASGMEVEYLDLDFPTSNTRQVEEFERDAEVLTRSSTPFSVLDRPSSSLSDGNVFYQVEGAITPPAMSEAGDSAWSDLGAESSDDEYHRV